VPANPWNMHLGGHIRVVECYARRRVKAGLFNASLPARLARIPRQHILDRRPGRRGGCPPRLPQIRTCPIKASGSSGHGFATHGASQAHGPGSGWDCRYAQKRAQLHRPFRCLRDSHFRHLQSTAFRNRRKASRFPMTP